MKSKLILSLVLFMIVLGSCTGPKVYTSRSCGINGRNGGVHTVSKTQAWYNHDAAMKRNNKTTIWESISNIFQ